MSDIKSPQLEYLPYGGVVSTVFVFQGVGVQNAANSVYLQKSTADAFYAATNPKAPNTYKFKTYYERMQYIIGRQGTQRGASGY
jgi:hypothetical protein